VKEDLLPVQAELSGHHKMTESMCNFLHYASSFLSFKTEENNVGKFFTLCKNNLNSFGSVYLHRYM
jgi:hypothetical protein